MDAGASVEVDEGGAVVATDGAAVVGGAEESLGVLVDEPLSLPEHAATTEANPSRSAMDERCTMAGSY